MFDLLNYCHSQKCILNFNFRALIIVKHIKIMLDDRANIKWDPDEEEEEPELNVGCLS